MDVQVKCDCGHMMVVSEFAIGMTSPCPACGKPLTVGPDNLTPLEPAAPARRPENLMEAIEVHGEAPTPPRPAGTHCDRCGRQFRGEWDMHNTVEGVLCHICAHRVREVDPSDPTAGYIRPVDSIKLDVPKASSIQAPVPEFEPETKTWYERIGLSEAQMGKIALGAGIAVISLAVMALFFDSNEVPTELDGGTQVADESPGEPQPVISPTQYWIATGIRWGIGFAGTFFGLYFFLYWINRLPNDLLLLNLLAVLPLSVVLHFIYMLPLFGWLLGGAFIFYVYDCEISHMLRLPVVWVIQYLLTSFLTIVVLGSFGLIVT